MQTELNTRLYYLINQRDHFRSNNLNRDADMIIARLDSEIEQVRFELSQKVITDKHVGTRDGIEIREEYKAMLSEMYHGLIKLKLITSKSSEEEFKQTFQAKIPEDVRPIKWYKSKAQLSTFLRIITGIKPSPSLVNSCFKCRTPFDSNDYLPEESFKKRSTHSKLRSLFELK